MISRLLMLAAVALSAAGSVNLSAQDVPPGAAQPVRDGYVISVEDELDISVEDHPELTGKFPVRADGTISIALLGRVPAVGQTVPELERALTDALADGLLRNPQVSVTLDRGRRVFIFGSVGSPGTYVLGDNESLIQALARAGYTAASEVIILRPKAPSSGPTLPESADATDVIRVNLKELEQDIGQGSLERNVVLREGDTIFAPRVDPNRVFVTGEVRTPGAYAITEGTTVLQALALAGGPTEQAAVNRLSIVRLENGRQRSSRARLSDVLQAGDTLVVPERFF